MSNTHEVISTFIDDEPFDPHELATALSDPAGRTLLVDLIALRWIVQPRDVTPAVRAPNPRWTRPWRVAAAAAVLCLALAGGYLVGERRAVVTSFEAPPPTRIVEAVPFVPTGGIR